MTDLHPGIVRFNVSWSQIAPSEPAQADDPADPAYRFSTLDAVARHAQLAGTRLLLSIVQTPAWANGGRDERWVPLAPSAFGAFCRAVARRYSGSFVAVPGEAPLPEVDRYTVGNEPNRGQYTQPQGRASAGAMASLMGACMPAIHTQNPAARIALGPLASRGKQGGLPPLRWLSAYAAARGPIPDALAFNPYLDGQIPLYRPWERPADGAVTLRNLDQLELTMRRVFGRPLPVWLTEFCIRLGRQSTGIIVDPATQAALAGQALALVRRHERYVGMFVWFFLRDQAGSSYWRGGLTALDGTRKPVFWVWAAAAQANRRR